MVTMKYPLFTLLCYIALAFISPQVEAQPASPALKVYFVNPGHQFNNATGLFWRNVSSAMNSVAEDLNIELAVSYANRNHILMKSQLRQAMSSDADYLVVVDEKKAVTQWLNGSPEITKPILFIFNAPDDEILESKPQWFIGYLAPNNFDAGYQLANALYHIAKSRFAHGTTLNLLALHGDYSTDSAISRKHGLELFLRQHRDIKLVHSDVANWSQEEGFRKSIRALARFKEINMVWAANDPIANGVVRAARNARGETQPVIGGINWDKVPSNVSADVSVGGHVLLGAAALIALYDAHILEQPFGSDANYPIFAANDPQFTPLINALHNKGLRDIDFTRFSKTAAQPLDFTLSNLAQCLASRCP
ncbi:hypothetical protein CWC24_06575 [Pseudoalteromonas ruthenica]|nr:hypothetical protein CWC24_06575 [Pseudoalteromonas ruthenica]TMO52694.1 hypothetical protein CWC23_01470 [Pseudoalteromonas ruthenica]